MSTSLVRPSRLPWIVSGCGLVFIVACGYVVISNNDNVIVNYNVVRVLSTYLETLANNKQMKAKSIVPLQYGSILAGCSIRSIDNIAVSGSVECVAGPANRSCMYTNVMFSDDDFHQFNVTTQPGLPSNRKSFTTQFSSKYGYDWTPKIHTKQASDDVRTMMSNRNVIWCPDTTLYFTTMWADNPAHGMWDALYPAYIAAIRFGYAFKPIRLLVEFADFNLGCSRDQTRACQFSEIIRDFGGLGLIIMHHLRVFTELNTTNSTDRWNNGQVVVFERLLVGSGQMGQRFMTVQNSLPGAREYNALATLRDRMYIQFHSSYRTWKPTLQPSIAIIDNRRFTPRDRRILAEFQTRARLELNQTIQWINWGKIWPWGEQLNILGTLDIYISGPGTGMLLHPFMPDTSVLINLGDCMQRYKMVHVSSQEDYFAEGTDYQRALYYNSSSRLAGLAVDPLLALLKTALDLIHTGFPIPVPPRVNLSPESQFVVAACDLAPNTCARMVDEMNALVPNHYQCVTDAWMSFVAYELGGFQEGGLRLDQDRWGKEGDGKNRTCTLPRAEMHQLRPHFASRLAQGYEDIRTCNCSGRFE